MNRKDIIRTHRDIVNALVNNKVAEALKKLQELINHAQSDELLVLLENYERTYKLILDYTIKGIEDPQRPIIHKKLIKSLLELNDKAKFHLLNKQPSAYDYIKKNIFGYGKQLAHALKTIHEDDYLSDQLSDLLSDIELEKNEELDKIEIFTADLFNYVWLSDYITDSDTELLANFFESNTFKTHQKQLIISALTLSCLNGFDKNKLLFLAKLVRISESPEKERAYTGFFLCMYLYDAHLPFFPEIEEALAGLSDDVQMQELMVFFLIQLIKAKDTEKFTRRMHEEILPDIIKHAPKIQERLDLDNILSEDMNSEENPEWQKILEKDPDLMKKLEELSKLQIEGTDIFMSTFAMLKNFPFFNVLQNWFVPFYKENPEVLEVMKNEDNTFKNVFLTALEKSGHMCNSDKYSFCLNVGRLPESQKKMMLQMFQAELDAINEVISEDNKVNAAFRSKAFFTQYIQDLYRFFKLFPQKNEFLDVFSYDLRFYSKNFYNKYFSNKDVLVKLVDFYFDNQHFFEAVEIYKILVEKGLNTQTVFEKLGFAYQQLKDYKNAIGAYQKAELFDTSIWTCTKIAFCFTKLNTYDEALRYYHEAEKLDSDNLKIQLQIANCYFHLGDIETALNHYFKLELLASSNAKVLRPIAWCLFILERFDEGGKYFNLLVNSSEANSYDFMNYGHWLWCTGKTQEAAAAYLNCINQKNNTFQTFLSGFRQDQKYLLKQPHISELEIAFMLDYLEINSV